MSSEVWSGRKAYEWATNKIGSRAVQICRCKIAPRVPSVHAVDHVATRWESFWYCQLQTYLLSIAGLKLPLPVLHGVWMSNRDVSWHITREHSLLVELMLRQYKTLFAFFGGGGWWWVGGGFTRAYYSSVSNTLLKTHSLHLANALASRLSLHNPKPQLGLRLRSYFLSFSNAYGLALLSPSH